MYNVFVKRFLDFVFCLLALPVFLLAFLIFAPLIYFTDRGPVFYNAPRLGYKGKVFKMFKFRSMRVNSPDLRNADGSTFNGEDDPRVTKVGRFMRKTSVDELPQFLNVLIGDMSLVGPRAHLTTHYTGYDNLDADQKRRLDVRPGITGYNQAYFRNSVNIEQKIKNDVYYADHISFGLDLKILLQTVWSVLMRKNIYVASAHMNDGEENKMKRLLIVGASILQLPAIRRAKELGYHVGVVDYNPQAIGIPYADEYFNVSTIDIGGVVETARKFRPDGIMTLATDMPMRSIAAVCEELGLPGISMATAIKSTDKGEMIKAFETHGVEHPWFFIAANQKEFDKVVDKVTFPCIMKPTDNSGSRGVVLCHSREQLLKEYDYARGESRGGGVILEEYMQGPEVSVEVICLDGTPHVLQVTDKLTTGAPHFVEMGHSQPSGLPEQDLARIRDLASRAVKAVGIQNGPAHVEIILTDSGPKMVELGARMGGDCITTHLVPLSTGIDMVETTIKLACGENVDIEPKFNKGAAIRYFKTVSGMIQAIEGIEEARKIGGVQEIAVVHQVGEKVGEIGSSTDRVGFVIAQAETAEDAVGACEKALKLIVVQIEN